ncbi:hypothetical protein OKW38_007623 [Paraburkholderia sp. MM5496-R1]
MKNLIVVGARPKADAYVGMSHANNSHGDDNAGHRMRDILVKVS